MADATETLWEVEVACPDADTARTIAQAAVHSRLAACAMVVPGVASVYRWQGEVVHEVEALLRLKSSPDLFPALCALIRARHPYDLPAITALPAAALGPGVAGWLSAELSRAAGAEGSAP